MAEEIFVPQMQPAPGRTSNISARIAPNISFRHSFDRAPRSLL